MKPCETHTLSPKQYSQDRQLSLFKGFLCNTEEERKKLSNTIEIWDSIPRYSISQAAMNKMRDPNGELDMLEVPFNYNQKPYKAVIRPARIEKIDYYPSANEELVEEALRKIGALQNHGFHEPAQRSGVVFTLYQLREELRKSGHSRSYSEIIRSLDVLSLSSIEIRGTEKMKGFDRSAYFPRLSAVSKSDYAKDPNSKWYVQFHPLVTVSIDRLAYRQFNYVQLMLHTKQLTRWLHKLLIAKYTFASRAKTFEIRYSTIKRDSAMLNNYTRERDAQDACDFSVMDELREHGVLLRSDRKLIIGARKKILDIVYTLTPSDKFVAEVKAANKRREQLSTTAK